MILLTTKLKTDTKIKQLFLQYLIVLHDHTQEHTKIVKWDDEFKMKEKHVWPLTV